MGDFYPQEFFQSVSSFWDNIFPILFVHIIAVLVFVWVAGNRWYILEKTEYMLSTDRYKRWRKILDEFDLRSKMFFIVAIGLFLYVVIFSSLLGIFGGFGPLSIVYSETEFWEETRPLDQLTEIGSYGTTSDVRVWKIYQIKQKFLQDFQQQYPDRFSELISWLSPIYGKWVKWYQLSLLFLIFIVILFVKLVGNVRDKKLIFFMRFLVILIFTVLAIILSRYQAEQYIERRLEAEMTFVLNQLDVDNEARKNRLNDEEIAFLRYQLYLDLKDTDQRSKRVWLSRILEKYFIGIRTFPHISDEAFQDDYSYLELRQLETQ